MGRWKKMKRLLAGVVAAVFLATQMPLDALADTDAGVETGDVEESVLVENEGEEESTGENEGIVVQADEGVQTGYVDGTDETVSWTYDPETKTTVVTGMGTRTESLSSNSPFPSDTEYIRFENCEMIGSYDHLFFELKNLLSIDFTGLTMTNVTNMGSMFFNCSSLTSLDLGNFDTSQVTDMGSMFWECSSLTSLDLKNFDTSQVTSMKYMFGLCNSLTSLDMGNFDTSQVADMKYMFSNCSSLTSLDIGNFDTSQVVNMEHMFSGCSSLTSLELGNFDTSQVTNMRDVFSGCSSLTSLELGNFDTSQVTNMRGVFSNCSSLTSLNLDNFNTSQVMDMGYMFGGCSSLTSLNLENFNTSQVMDMASMFRDCSSLTSLDLENFDTSQVTDTKFMFSGSGLISLDLGNFDTSQVTDMRDMFWGCSSLTSLILENFDTSHVTHMGDMFSGCSSLTSLNLGNFDTSQVTYMGAMFWGCSGLTNLDLGNFDTSQVTNMGGMFGKCVGLTSLNLENFDTGQVTYMWGMFSGNNSLTSLNLDNFDTSQVINMKEMFLDCSSLMSLDLGNFDTSQVMYMEEMFSGCCNLLTLHTPQIMGSTAADLPGTYSDLEGNLTTELTAAFAGTTLTKQDAQMGYAGYVDGTNKMISWTYDPETRTIVVTGTGVRVTRESVSTPDFPAETEHIRFENCEMAGSYAYLFYGLENLLTIDFTGLNMINATNMREMFRHCDCLTGLDMDNFDTSQVTDMYGMFSYCSSLTSLNLGNFDTSQVTNMGEMFSGCSSLANLNLKNFDTSQVTSMGGMFWVCSSLTSLDIGNFDTSQVATMAVMFAHCNSLMNLNLENFNTSQVTNIWGMFSDCFSLTSLDLGNFDTSQVTNMSDMFSGCSNLAKIYTPYATAMPSAEPPQLPSVEEEGVAWRGSDGTEFTELPLGLPSSILLTRYSASDSPAITTTTTDLNMDDVIRVKYVPYSYTVKTDNENEWNQVTFSIVEGRLAEGLMMYPATGEIYGVPLEAGEFKVKVMATYSIPEYLPSYAELTLIVLENTDENVGSASDAGYEIIQPVPNLDLGALPADGSQLLVSEGEYAQFQDIYLDGVKLIKGVEYTAEPGSTRVTIQNQTLSDTGAGSHTIGIEFRTPEDNTLMRAAQNVEITVADDSGGKVPDNGDADDYNRNEYIFGETTVIVIYTVMPGDNLWKISVKFYGTGTLWTRIYKDNAAVIRDPNKISVGQKLTITLAATGNSTMTNSESGEQAAGDGTAGNSKVRVYRVMPGDTLWDISRKVYGTGWLWEKIYRANRNKIMSPRYLRVGLEIVIPER